MIGIKTGEGIGFQLFDLLLVDVLEIVRQDDDCRLGSWSGGWFWSGSWGRARLVARAQPCVEIVFEVIGNINGIPIDDAFVMNFGVHAEFQISILAAVHGRAAVINDLFVIQPNPENSIASLRVFGVDF